MRLEVSAAPRDASQGQPPVTGIALRRNRKGGPDDGMALQSRKIQQSGLFWAATERGSCGSTSTTSACSRRPSGALRVSRYGEAGRSCWRRRESVGLFVRHAQHAAESASSVIDSAPGLSLEWIGNLLDLRSLRTFSSSAAYRRESERSMNTTARDRARWREDRPSARQHAREWRTDRRHQGDRCERLVRLGHRG